MGAFTDDVIIAKSGKELQDSLTEWDGPLNEYGIKMNKENTKVINIKVDHTHIKLVELEAVGKQVKVWLTKSL